VAVEKGVAISMTRGGKTWRKNGRGGKRGTELTVGDKKKEQN